MKQITTIKKYLSSIFPFSIESFAARGKPFTKAKTIVQFFYYFLAFQALVVINGGKFLSQEENFSPVWSIPWANHLSLATTANIVQFFFLISAFIGAFFFQNRIARIFVFLGIFQLNALLSSVLRADHHWYPWLYVSFLLIFLPDAWAGKAHSLQVRKKFLLVFFSAQAVTLFIYSMAGLGKIQGAISQYFAGQTHAFAPEALALHIAYWLRNIDSTSLLGSFFVEHVIVGWPLFLGMIYLQFFSLWIAFKPSLHKIWAFGLIFMHTGIYLTMDMLFFPTALLLIFLFFDSPFKKHDTSWRETVGDLPIFGWMLRRILFRPGNSHSIS